MSRADEVSRALRGITATCSRAEALASESLHARAADKYGEAAAAMEALDTEPDNLVAVLLRATRVSSLITVAYENAFAPAGSRAAARQAALLELPLAVAALRRREAANTLLRGRCRALEEAWQAQSEMEHCRRYRHPAPPQHILNVYSTVVGYNAFMTVAVVACIYFMNVMTAAQTTDDMMMMSFVASALDYIRAGMLAPGESVSAEVELVTYVNKAVEVNILPVETDAGRELLSAWRRLQRSGELTSPRLLERLNESAAYRSRPELLDMPSANTRCCALPACNAPELRASAFRRCAACMKVVYCCKEHQVADWPRHKPACKAARAGAAAGAPPAQL